MRIGIDATALFGRYGGVQYAVWNLLYALSQQKTRFEYVVYIPADGPSLQSTSQFGPQWHWQRLPFLGNERARRILWQQLQLPASLKKHHCDLLYAPTYVMPARTDIPTVLTVFDLIALDHPEFATRSNRWHYRMLLPLSLRRAHQVVVPSEAVKESVRLRLGEKVRLKTSVVALGVEPLFLEPQGEDQFKAASEGYALPQKYFLHVGNHEPKKNLAALVTALGILKKRRSDVPDLVCTGGARPWLHQKVSPGVIDIGYVRRRHLPALYAGSTGFIFPSLAEGFGLPVLEALACGTPVITTPHVPIEGVEDHVQIVDPRDPERLATAMEHLLDDVSLAARTKRQGPQFAASFTWQAAAERMLDIFTRAAPEPRT